MSSFSTVVLFFHSMYFFSCICNVSFQCVNIFSRFKIQNYFTSSDPHHDMLGGGCQVRVVIYFYSMDRKQKDVERSREGSLEETKQISTNAFQKQQARHPFFQDFCMILSCPVRYSG